MLAAPGFSSIVQRVRNLRLAVPKPNLGIDYDWSFLGSSPASSTYCLILLSFLSTSPQ